MTEKEELPTAAKLKRWSKSGLIEEAVVYDNSTFQTEEFDRDNLGDLLKEELVRRKDAEKVQEKAKENLAKKLYIIVSMEGGLETRVEIQEKLESIIKSYRADLNNQSPKKLRETCKSEISVANNFQGRDIE